MNNPCEKMQGKIVDYVLGVLNAEEIESLREHLGQCLWCSGYAESLQSEKRLLTQFGENLDKQSDIRQARVIETLNHVFDDKARPVSAWIVFMQSRITKFAAAAVILFAALTGVIMLNISGDQPGTADTRTPDVQPGIEIVKQQSGRQKQIAVEIPKETDLTLAENVTVAAAEKLKAELKDIERMFAAGDVGGLVAMLDKGQWESKIAAANYLAKIGDAGAIEPLERLSGKWDAEHGDDPFAKAIEGIRSRIEQKEQAVAAALPKTEGSLDTNTADSNSEAYIFRFQNPEYSLKDEPLRVKPRTLDDPNPSPNDAIV